ncbi:unnamed protein product [Angiostrongylus costaricensis]|uniref:Rab3 GTPase-activating protein catalytic subunit n=1 Tax=Angiostrongylus costaricensis TaxID=334426 RepID=A0A158PJD5_ANGCS|nr:unnamed protein product [Angiostrongylus costaricensis]
MTLLFIALDLFLSAIHEELSLYFDTCFAVEDESFWVQVAPLLRLNHNYDTQLPGMVCRVYMREVTPWVLSVVVVPTTVSSIDKLDAVPLLFSLCDEPLLAWNLAKRKTPPSERVLDRRFLPSPLSSCHEDVPPIEIPPKEWISSSRCLDVLRENYKPGSLGQTINDVDEKVVTKAIVSTLYAAVQRGANIDHAIVRNVLDEQCECTSLEVDGVAMSLSTFCSHMNADRNNQSQPSYCGESKVQLKFANILRGTFKQVPGMPYFFYTPPHKESDSRFPGKSVLAYFEGLFNDHQPRGLDSTLLERRNSDDHVQDDRVSAPVSLRKLDRLVDQSRPRYVLNDSEKPRSGDEKQAKTITQYGRYPLFIYFMCSVEYPNKSMDTFPVTFLPTCVYEVLRESAQKPHEAFDIASVVVRLYLYVVTWPSDKGENMHEDIDTESDDDTHSNKHLRFLEKMPKKERSVVYELLNRLNRLMELETVLMDSRNVPVTKERIMEISAYIDHECGREKAVENIHAFERYTRHLASSGMSEDHEVDTHISHGARFMFAPGYFACPLQEKLWFEVHPRLRLSRGNCRYPLAIACDTLRISLEQFAIRNIPNTYVVRIIHYITYFPLMYQFSISRESDGNVSYMQLHTSIDTFNASLKRNRITVRKKRDTRESEHFKTHMLLAVYGVNRPGREICEVLRECLQKRLDQVTLSHMIDILAKNSQTRLDSADVLEDFGSGSNNSTEQKSVFLPLPYLGKPSESYVPIFYLLVKSPQGGIRSTGIAVIEMRFMNSRGEMATLTNGRLNSSTHQTLAPMLDEESERDLAYSEMTYSARHEQLEEIPGVSAYAQFAVWQAGDVDLQQLDDQLRHVVGLGICDVVTEFGILNLNIIEIGAQIPLSPGLHSSPHSKSLSSAKTPTTASERRQQLRKRDSFDALPVASTPSLQTDSSARSKGNSVFSFETHRGSFTSDIDRLSSDFVYPENHSLYNSVFSASCRSPDYVNPGFVSTAGLWFDFVVDKQSGSIPSFLSEKGERYTSILRHSWMFDCRHTVNKALREIADRILEQVRNVDPNYPDRVQIFEPTPRTNELMQHSSTSSWTSSCSTKLRERRYEAAPSTMQYCMSADIGRDPYDCDVPDAILICMDVQVAIETQRFGFDPVGACPETLLRLNNCVSKELFLPCTEESQFIPRRRLLYGTVHGEKLTLYFYNFMPFLSASLMNMVARATSWYNARARLVREIGLHKMGITHLSPLEHFQSPSNNPYLVLVWRHPEELMDKDYPPDDLQVTAIDALPKGYSSSLFRLYRRDHNPHLLVHRSPCLIQDQLEQMRNIRRHVRDHLNIMRAFTTLHESLLSGNCEMSEADLEKLRSASKLVHFVETPVLFFPKWRRNIAEVRGAMELDPRKDKIAPAPLTSLAVTRQRANTLSVTPSAPAPFRIRSDVDDDDPCQAKILYLLMADYVSYLSLLGLQLLKVTNVERRSEERHMYTTNYPQGCKHAPFVVMCKAMEDSVQHIRELEHFKDVIVTECHLHSFTYDFHLRMLSKYLNSEESTEQRRDDFMLVSSELKGSNDGTKELFRVVLRDNRHDRSELHLVFYLIAVATEIKSPLEEERHREDSRQSEVGEFKNFEKKEPADRDNTEEVDAMIKRIIDGDLPSVVDGNFPTPVRRRFSSGGHLRTSPTLPPLNKTLNIDGTIPGEQVTYVHFLSARQRSLQKVRYYIHSVYFNYVASWKDVEWLGVLCNT